MQPDELRAMRQETGLTQEQFATHMGVSRKALNEMENGRAPIERRSMMAARQAFNELSRLSSAHEVTPTPEDVPLREAMFLWDEEPQDGHRIIVVQRGEDDQRFTSSYGASNSEWIAADDIGRLLRLFSKVIEWTVEEKIKPREVHRALSVIPEYRRALFHGLFRDGVGRG